jgi:molybdopterin converting factor small subunit
MTVDLLIFGQLKDIFHTSNMKISDWTDTDSLQRWLKEHFPALADAKFVIAVNGTIIQQNTLLSDGYTVALLPPFSGG